MQSHPSWVRGLKQNRFLMKLNSIESHPSWVRGLKLVVFIQANLGNGVAPLVGAWIETQSLFHAHGARMSHPSWVRGLKHSTIVSVLARYMSRTPRGCVD